MSTTRAEVTDHLQSLCGPPLAGDEFGYVYGDGDGECTAAACVWRPTVPALRQAADTGVNLLVAHEALFLGHQDSGWYPDAPADDKPANRLRRELLAAGGLSVFRAHSAWDNAPGGHSVPDCCAAVMGWDELHAASEYCRVYRIPPTPLGWLAEVIGSAMARDLGDGAGVTRPRVFGNPARRIERVGLAVGGFGGNQFYLPLHLAELGAEAIVAGDLVEQFALVAAEAGLAVIETLHSWTEEHAIRRQAALLRERFAPLAVHFWPTGIEAAIRPPCVCD